jgi:chromosome partitioning protein
VRTHFGEQVLETVIPRSVRVSEAPSYGQTVVTYDPTSPGALAYREAAMQVIGLHSLLSTELSTDI